MYLFLLFAGRIKNPSLLIVVDVEGCDPGPSFVAAAAGHIETDVSEEARIRWTLRTVSVARTHELSGEERTFDAAGRLAIADDLEERCEVHDDRHDERADANEDPDGQH